MKGWTKESFARFSQDQRGAVAVEYSFIAIAMFLAIIAAFPSISTAVKGKLLSIGGYFASV